MPSIAAFMVALSRHARLLCWLALFQVVGGPLVLGGLMLAMRLMTQQEMTLAQSITLSVEKLTAHTDAFTLKAGPLNLEDSSCSLPDGGQEKAPRPTKLKDGKDKLWALEDLGRLGWRLQIPTPALFGDWHDPVPRCQANAPPLPPPRLG